MGTEGHPDHTLKSHLIPTFSLAIPVVASQLGIMTMILVDTFMVAKIGAAAVAGVGLGSSIYSVLLVFSGGALMGLDALSARAFGRNDRRECRFWLVQACYLAVILGIFGTVVVLVASRFLGIFGIEPAILDSARTFLSALSYSLTPTLLFIVIRQYLASTSDVRVTTMIIVAANGVNLFGNWVFIQGNLGAPALGARGSGIATTCTRLFMVATIAVYATLRERKASGEALFGELAWDGSGMKALVRLGLPSGLMFLARAAVFTVAGVGIARLGPVDAAAHTIALNIGSFLYMIPIGLATASCILVGQSLGAERFSAAKAAGWTGIAAGGGVMFAVGLLLFFVRNPVFRAFTLDESVVAQGAVLLIIIASFQVTDAIQTITAGALRGFKDTRTPLWVNILCLWGIGLPVGWGLCFHYGQGVAGLWVGLTVGLLASAALLLQRWRAIGPSVEASPGSR